MDRWAIIRQVAARTRADFEAKTKSLAFTEERGIACRLVEVARECFEQEVTPDPDLDSRHIGYLHDFFGITYWPGLTPERRDFTIAHEIGHLALGHPPRLEPEPSEDIDDAPVVSGLKGRDGVAPAYDSRDRYELEANIFAAEFLAPVVLIRDKTRANLDWSLEQLTQYFGLSREAMANQLIVALLPGPEEANEEENKPLKPLDADQQIAAQISGSALVVAGPGAGKTRVLTERYRYLVEVCGVPPRNILALTFANKAADEMRSRLVQILPAYAHEIYVSTFHSLGLQLLTSYGGFIGRKVPVQTLSDIDAFVLLRNRLGRLQLGRFEDLGQPTRNLPIILDAIKKAKNELMGPDEYAESVDLWRAETEHRVETASINDRKAINEELQKIEKFSDVARVYRQYQDWLDEAGFVDYGDLIMAAVSIFDSSNIALDIHTRYTHILVDEFQDINYASGRLIQELDGGRGVTWAVGDPKQSIFRFQGASLRNLSQFQKAFPGSSIVSLGNNYRSTEDIVAAGDAVIFPGSEEYTSLFPRSLRSMRGRLSQTPGVKVGRTNTKEDELQWLSNEIRQLRTNGESLGNIAVLCRTRDQAQTISDYLESQEIPTNWEGILQNSPLFKDLLAIIGLAADDPRSLVRLATMPEHALDESDLRLLVRTASERKSAAYALYRAKEGEIEELSRDGVERCTILYEFYAKLFQRSTPWAMLSAYLFELSNWLRLVFTDDSPEGLRVKTSIGQVADLTRNFRRRGIIADGEGAKEFLRYVSLAVESRRLEISTTPPIRKDAVHIVTMHGSKGLEWPVVFLPHLVEDTWKGGRTDLPFPRFLPREKDPLDSDVVEESSLIYVSVTRAENYLFMSSAREGHFPDREISEHRLLINLCAKIKKKEFIQQLDVASYPATLQEREEEKSVYGPFQLPSPIPHKAIASYEHCGLKFLFQYVYRLPTEDEQYNLLKKCVRKVHSRMAAALEEGYLLTDEEIKREFSSIWEKVAKDDKEKNVYFARGMEALFAFQNRLEIGKSLKIHHEEIFDIEGREFSLRIDELQESSGRWIVRHHHLGRPTDRHPKDPFFLTLPIISKEKSLRTVLAVLDYPLHQNEVKVILPKDYLVIRHRMKLLESIKAIESGQFMPPRNLYFCKNCGFKLVCPKSKMT